MTSFEIFKYNNPSHISIDTAQQVSNLFAYNYPSSHSQSDREDDITGKSNADAIIQSLDRGITMYVASDENTVAGFIESRTVDQPDGSYEQLTWIMTAAEYRGRHLASLLHKSFIIDSSLRAIQRAPKPTLALLSVHENNPARAIYEGWGYSVIEKTESNKLLMTKQLPVAIKIKTPDGSF